MLDVKEIRRHFSIYESEKNLCYLDSAASALKLKESNEALNKYLEHNGTNVHRGVYKLSYEATLAYEETREVVANFLNAKTEEIVYTRGATEALNMTALLYGMKYLNEGDEVISSELEHHSSLMPWLKVATLKKAKMQYVPLASDSRITVENFKKVLSKKTKVVCLTHVSNVLGYITPIKEIIKLAHEVGAVVVVDGAQGAPHLKVDVKDLDCDFYCFSAHKLCGPTGVGILYGKKSILDNLDPLYYGGDMADQVYLDKMTYKDTPYKFEAGTMMIGEVIALKEAILFLEKVGLENIQKHEEYLKDLALKELKQIPNVIIYNENVETGIIAFNIKNTHPHDAASVYDKNNVCLRAGHHCALPVIRHLQCVGTLRASFYLYNDEEDVKKFVEATKEAAKFFEIFM